VVRGHNASMPVSVSRREFEALVSEAIDALPEEFLDQLDNVVFVVEDRPPLPEDPLLGVYEGVALTERSPLDAYLPDRIVVFREPLCDMARDLEDLADQVYVTVVHEVGHYFGVDDDRLDELGWG